MEKEAVIDEVLETVAEVAPHISSGLLKRREYVGEENPSNEKQLEADVWANEFLKEEITSIDGVGEFASEEEQGVTQCGEGLSVTIDPLDGSSNIPTNNLVGTIVGIYDGELPCKGENLIAAFYVVYGPLTSFTVARDGKVNEYVLEKGQGDKASLHKASEDINISGKNTYGFGGNENWKEDFREFEDSISKDLKLRYGGSLVGDFNQMIHHGGIFGYPARTDAENGKYRILFEGNPMAFIAENASGSSTNGEKSILEIKVDEVHQRVPFFAGHPELIGKIDQEL